MRASTIALLIAAVTVAVLFLSLEGVMRLAEANLAAHSHCAAPCKR